MEGSGKKPRRTKKVILREQCEKLGIKHFATDNTAILQERINAHNENRPFVQPPKQANPFKKKTTRKPRQVTQQITTPSKAFKHLNGRVYKFRAGRTHVILKGTKYTVLQALRSTVVMNELIKRNHAGLMRVN